MLGLFRDPDFVKRQRVRLAEACGRHLDFLDACVDRLSQAPLLDVRAATEFNSWLSAELHARSRGGQDRLLWHQLRKVPLALIMERADNEILSHVIRWNELALFESDRFFAGIDLSDEIHGSVHLVSKSCWIIETTFGYRQLMSDLMIVFWETFTGRCKVDPYAHLGANFDLAAQGRPIEPYPSASIEHVHQTEWLARFAKMFLFAHELGHVNALKTNLKFSRDIDEEVYADEFAAELHIAAGLMLVPPMSKHVAAGRIRTVSDRREFFAKHPGYSKFVELDRVGFSVNQNVRAQLLRDSGVYADEEELTQGQALTGMLWVVPILVFKMIEQLELRRPATQRQKLTHPCAADRIAAFWKRWPNDNMRMAMYAVFGNTLDRLFGRTG